MTVSAPDDAHHSVINSLRPEMRIVAISVATAALYITSNCIVRSLFRGATASSAMAAGRSYSAARMDVAGEMALYAIATLGLFATYFAVLSMCRRGELALGRARTWAVLTPCALSVLLTVWTPALSEDVFSYMAHGILGVTPGANPLLQPAEDAASTAIGPELAAYGWHGAIGITPYGIVWTRIEVAVMRLSGNDVATALVVMKSVVSAASLATAYLIWVFLGRVHPTSQLLGTLAYLWNPVILAEFSGEGHNDAVMLLFVIAALAACAAKRPALSVMAQLLGFLTKYISVLFFPAHLVYLWRTRRSVGRLMLEIVAAVMITGIVAAVLYAPLWAGEHSMDGLLRRGQPISSATLFGATNWVLRRSPLALHAGSLSVALVTLPLLAFVAWSSLRVKDAADLARTFAWIAVGYLLIASPDYWPWYACMPIALLIVADSDGLLWLVMLMSVTARLCAPLDLIRDHGFLSMIGAKGALTGFGATLPLIVLVLWLFYRRRSLESVFA